MAASHVLDGFLVLGYWQREQRATIRMLMPCRACQSPFSARHTDPSSPRRVTAHALPQPHRPVVVAERHSAVGARRAVNRSVGTWWTAGLMTEGGTSALPVLAVSGRGEIEPGSGCGVSGAVAADGGAITVHHTRPQWAGL